MNEEELFGNRRISYREGMCNVYEDGKDFENDQK